MVKIESVAFYEEKEGGEPSYVISANEDFVRETLAVLFPTGVKPSMTWLPPSEVASVRSRAGLRPLTKEEMDKIRGPFGLLALIAPDESH